MSPSPCARAPGPLIALFCLAACSSPMPDAPPGSTALAVAAFFLEPAAELGVAPAVLRIHVQVKPARQEPPELSLFHGPLSEYHLGRIRRRELPSTLEERLVPSTAWQVAAGHTVVAPLVHLEAGSAYSLGSPSLGLVGTFAVAWEDPVAQFVRIWPPPGEPFGLNYAVYCAPDRAPPADVSLQLSPGTLSAEIMAGAAANGVASERCFHVAAPAGGEAVEDFLVPAPRLQDASIDPAPLYPGEALAPVPAQCAGAEQPFGPACASVEDDRIRVRTGPDPALWAVRGPGIDLLQLSLAGESFSVRGLLPASRAELDVIAIDRTGGLLREVRAVWSEPARARIVINEVLANPAGAEPAQEWLEIINDGVSPIELSELELWDSASGVALPDGELPPGAFAVIVSSDFLIQPGSDVALPGDCTLLRVPKIGKGGITNSGEMLTLRSRDGRALSQFMGMPSTRSGVSLARRSPDAPDADPASFAAHAPPGASPCASNTL